jgi:hypothetical protein
VNGFSLGKDVPGKNFLPTFTIQETVHENLDTQRNASIRTGLAGSQWYRLGRRKPWLLGCHVIR